MIAYTRGPAGAEVVVRLAVSTLIIFVFPDTFRGNPALRTTRSSSFRTPARIALLIQ
ncbi:MAG: hypothetical protein GX671_07040 [Clostridiales bacterium]|nr:hypothetical protein [Clostridiales bacterium]